MALALGAVACILLAGPAAAQAVDAGLGVQLDPAVEAPQAPQAQVPLPVTVPEVTAVPAVPAVKTAPLELGVGLGPAKPAPAPPSLPERILDAPATPVAVGVGAVGAGAIAIRFLPALLPLKRVLGGLLGLGLFSRIQPDEVLEHATRAQIMDLLAASPGLTVQEVQARLGVAWGTAVHHVRRLEGHGEVVSVRQGPRKLLFAANTPEARSRSDLALLRTETAHRIGMAVLGRPGIQQAELCGQLGMRTPAASKHLGRMAAAGLVAATREGGRVRYEPTPRLEAALRLGAPVAPARTRPARPEARPVRVELCSRVHPEGVAVAA